MGSAGIARAGACTRERAKQRLQRKSDGASGMCLALWHEVRMKRNNHKIGTSSCPCRAGMLPSFPRAPYPILPFRFPSSPPFSFGWRSRWRGGHKCLALVFQRLLPRDLIGRRVPKIPVLGLGVVDGLIALLHIVRDFRRYRWRGRSGRWGRSRRHGSGVGSRLLRLGVVLLVLLLREVKRKGGIAW